MIAESEFESFTVLLRDNRFVKRLAKVNRRIVGGEALGLDDMASALRISRRLVEVGLILGAIRADAWTCSCEHVERWRELDARVDAGECFSLEQISEYVAAPPELVLALMASAANSSTWGGGKAQ